MNATLPFGLSSDEESLALLSDTIASALRTHEEAPEVLWDALSREIGLGGAIISEQFGGMGGGGGALWVVMEALGRSPTWTPYLASTVLGAGALRHASGALGDAILPRVVSGDVVLALAYLESGRRNAIQPEMTKAVLQNGVYRVNGAKVGSLGLDKADFLIFSAAGPGSGVTLFCV